MTSKNFYSTENNRFKLILEIFCTLQFINLAIGDTPNECGIKYCLSCDQSTQLCLKCKGDLIFSREDLQCLPITDCPIGQYRLSKAQQCRNCHSSCKSCKDSNFNHCYECVDGYTFIVDDHQNFKCISCAVQNCLSCNYLGICAICQDGYTLNNTSGLCEQCLIPQCQDCSNSKQTCNLCFSSFSLSSNKTICELKGNCGIRYFEDSQEQCIKSCDPSCTHCYDFGNNSCYDCADGYYLSGELCLKCSDSCQTCQYRSDYCTSCLKGSSFVLDGSICNINCPYEQYSESNVCFPCPPKCSSCFNKDTCMSCTDPNQQRLTNDICENVCPDGQYNAGDEYFIQCKNCDSNCKTCYYQDFCSTCEEGLIFQDFRCVKKCNTDQYSEQNTFFNLKLCRDCPFPCSSCNNARECTSCMYGLTNGNDGSCYYEGNEFNNCSEGQVMILGLCLDQCPEGSLQLGDICVCDYSCKKCSLDKDPLRVDCDTCLNSRDFQVKGVCYSKCPNGQYLFTQKNGDKSCVQSCPLNTIAQISDQQKSCVRRCSQGFILEQNTCIQAVCLKRQFFDLKSYFSNEAANQEFKTYCTNCDISCNSCNGTGAKDCITCKSGLVSQKLVDSSGTAYISCQKNCNSGYDQTTSTLQDGSTFQECQICYSKCQFCASDHYSIMTGLLNNTVTSVYNCYDDCPSGTVSNSESMTCIIQISSVIDIQIDNSTGFLCAQANIPIIFSITSIVKLSASLSPICIIKELNTQLAMLNSQTGVYSKYKGVIFSNTLQEGQNYKISCSSIINNQNFLADASFSTFKLNKGEFQVSPTAGVSNDDTFWFSISQFTLQDSIDSITYLLQYALLAELPNSRSTLSNITIFKTSDSFYFKNSYLKTNFNYTLPYVFPEISSKQDINVFLIVTGVSDLSQTYHLSLHISPSQSSSSNINKVSPIITSIITSLQDTNSTSSSFNSEQLSKFQLQLQTSGFLPILDLGQNDNLIKQQGFQFQLIPCDDISNCSSNGVCKKNITSYYFKCDCKSGYSGEKCSWKLSDLNVVSKIFQSSLSSLQTEFDSIASLPVNKQKLKLEKLAQLLTNMGKIRDVFNEQSSKDYLLLLQNDEFYTSSTSQDQAESILYANDLGIDIQRKFNQIDHIPKIKENIQKSLFYYFQKMNLGHQYQFALTNIDGILSDLSLANSNSDNVAYFSTQSTWSVNIPTNIFGNRGSQLFAQVINWPSDFDEFQNKTQDTVNFNFKISSLVDITIRKKESLSEIFTVENIQSPINFSLNQTVTDSEMYGQFNKSWNISCQYQLNNGSWVSEGLKTTKNQGNSIINCQTYHLTSFSIGAKQIAPQPSPLSNQNNEEKKIDNFKAFGTSNFCLILLISHIISLILYLKKNQKKKYLERDSSIKLTELKCSPKKPEPQSENEPKLQLEGVTIGIREEFPPIAGIPLDIKEQPNSQPANIKKSNKLHIDQVDISNGFLVQANMQQTKYAMNLARRAKEGEIDLFAQEDKDEFSPDKQNFNKKDREINFIPISTFYQGDQKIPNNLNKEVKNEFTSKQQGEEYQINFEIPQGIPEEKNEQEKEYMKEEPLSEQIINNQSQQHFIMNYHPIFTFTRDLQRVGMIFRVFVFFEVFCLIETLTLSYSTYNSKIKFENYKDYALVLLFTTIARRLINFLISFGFSVFAILQKICFKEATIANSVISKYICLQAITVICLLGFYKGSSAFQQTSDVGQWLLSFAINFFIDFFILEFILLKSHTFCCKEFLLRLAQRSNFDLNL